MFSAQAHLTVAAVVAAGSLASIAARKGIMSGLNEELKRELERESRNWTTIWRLCDERASVRMNQDRFVTALFLQVGAMILAFSIDAGSPQMSQDFVIIGQVLSGVPVLVVVLVAILIAWLVRHRHSPL